MRNTLSHIMKNKYCYYTSSHIRRYTFSCIKKCLLSLYALLYNDNKYFNYTSSRIRRYTFSCIKKCLLSLYIVSYKTIYIFLYQEMFVVII